MAATDVRSASRRAENHDDDNWQFTLAVTFCYRMQRPGRGALNLISQRMRARADTNATATTTRAPERRDRFSLETPIAETSDRRLLKKPVIGF